MDFSFYGLLNLPWWGYVIFTLVVTHITMVCVTVFLHRSQAHRALDLHPIMSHFFRLWLWLTTGMKTKEWVAVHRKHHAKCETEEDPHSPVVAGLPKILWEGAEMYRIAKKDPDMLVKYGKGTPNDWLEKYVYHAKFLRGKTGVLLMLLIDLLLLGVPGLIVWGIQMAWTPFFAAGVINGVGHFFGYRNFECTDASTNIIPWGIIIAGEELHNNHHAYGTSAKLSVKWWEFDIGWMYINIMRAFGLAKVKRLPPKMLEDSSKTEIDTETVKALFINRLQVLAQYSKQVVVPVFKSERNTWDGVKRSALSRRVKTLLIRDNNLISADDKPVLTQALSASDKLAKVYGYRDKLMDIWNNRNFSNEELLNATKEWCHQAEKSGIDSLAHFVSFVRGYQLKSA